MKRECARCGTPYKQDLIRKIHITEYGFNGTFIVPLCEKCQYELEQWIKGDNDIQNLCNEKPRN